MDFLKSAVASAISKDPPFPYKFGDRVTVNQSIWTLYNGTKREDGSDCSIFTFDVTADKSRLPLARNAVRKMRTLRHPGVIKVYDTVETETYIYVATERVIPLSWSARRKTLSVEASKWGLFTIANTLSFINDEASSIHGNVRLSSVFNSQSGEWRLGGLEVLSSPKDDDPLIYRYGSFTPDSGRYAPPEIAKANWDVIKRYPLPAVDSYDFGILVFEVFNGGCITADQIGQVKGVPPSMHLSYKRLLNANPKARLSVSHFRDQGRRSGGFFETPLIKLSEDIDRLGLKSEGERDDFLSELDEVAEDFPEEFYSVKVLPELLKSVEFGGGGPKVFSSVMNLGKKLSDEEWESKITPVIIRLFSNPDRAIRVCLLDCLPNMIDHLSLKVVNDKIFPQLVTGFTDVAPLVREQTVKAVLTIITKLSDRTINGDLLKQLAKTSNDEQPGIRTNTTICLGKIARNLGTSTRQKVLVSAFSRSLRDPFVHARNAALLALAATSDLFTDDDCATKILPALCPSLVDKEKLVRDQANKCFDVYLHRIRKYGNSLPDTVLPPPAIVAANDAVPCMGTPHNDTPGWAGWAISSFTNKLGTASGDIQSEAAKTQQAKSDRSSSVPPMPPATDSFRPPLSVAASTLHRQVITSTSTSTQLPTPIEHYFKNPTESDQDIDEAWGELVEDTSFDVPTEAKSNTAPPISFDDGGEPDFEGWLKAQDQAKSKGPLPKGLARPSANVSTVSNGRQAVTRTTTTGSVGAGAGAKRLASTVAKPKSATTRAISTKPKETEDDWGDAWD